MKGDARWVENDAYDFLQKILETSQAYKIEVRTSYAGNVEFGAGPAHEPDPRGHFMPPKQPILEWVKRKLRVMVKTSRLREGIFYEVRHRRRKLKDDEAEKAAEAIRWSIYHHGIEPQPFARPAVNDLSTRIGPLAQEAILNKEEPIRLWAEFTRERMRNYIDQNGTGDMGTMAREMYIVEVADDGL